MWGRKGELFYVDLNGTMNAVTVALTPNLSVGRVTKLFDGETPPRAISLRPYDNSPIDGRFLVAKAVSKRADDAVDVSVVLNWFGELLARVPLRIR